MENHDFYDLMNYENVELNILRNTNGQDQELKYFCQLI